MDCVESNGRCVLRIHVQPQHSCTCRVGRAFHAAQQCAAYSPAAPCGSNLDRFDIGCGRRPVHSQTNCGEPGRAVFFCRDPRGSLFACQQLAEISAAEAKWWLERRFLDAVKSGKVTGLIEAINHECGSMKREGHPRCEDGPSPCQRSTYTSASRSAITSKKRLSSRRLVAIASLMGMSVISLPRITAMRPHFFSCTISIACKP